MQELGFIETVRLGYRGAWPDDTTPPIARAFRVLRISAYVVPLASVLVGVVLVMIGRSIDDSIGDMMNEMGFFALFAMILFIPILIAAWLAEIVGYTLVLLAIPAAFGLAWALGRLLDPSEPPMLHARLVIAFAAALGIIVSGLLVMSVWGIVLLPVTLLPVAGWWMLRRGLREHSPA